MKNVILMGLTSVAIFAALTILCSPRFACFSKGRHDWSAPWTETKRRVRRCERCGIVRDYVHTTLKAPIIDQREIDGSGWDYQSPAKPQSSNVVSMDRKKA